MFYKHWKKLALALTGLFWASCDNSTSAEGPDTNGLSSNSNSENKAKGSDLEKQSSSSSDSLHMAMPLYGVRDSVIHDIKSSASVGVSSSSEGKLEIIAPAYGVFDQVPCYDVSSDRQTLMREKDNGITMLQCKDGVTCQEKITENWVSEYECIDDICPDYGVVKISEKSYACDDGNVYNEAEFQARYYKRANTKDTEQDTTFNGEIQPALYGPPCVFNGTCDDN